MKEIATAFVKAQNQFAPALKTATIGHLNRKYADLASCVEAVIDALNNNGIAMIQKTHDCDNGVAVETVLLHESGESMSGGILHVPAAKQDPQGYGSALTYARRYSLMAACGIAPEDDDAETAMKSQAKPIPRKEKEEVRQPRSNEELSVLINACETVAALQILYAGLTPLEKDNTGKLFTKRKGELIK